MEFMNANLGERVKGNPKPVPEVIKEHSKKVSQEDTTVMSADQVKDAKKELVNDSYVKLSFPKRQKLRVDPPLNGQTYCLHSFIPSPGASPDKDGVYGLVKFRGAFPTESEADEWSEHLIRNVDSLNGIYVGYVGREFPLVSNYDYVSEVKEHDLKQKMDKVAREDIKKKQEEEKKTKDEIEKRKEDLIKPPDDDYDKSVEYYTTLRVKRATILYHFDEIEKKKVELKATLEKTVEDLEKFDKEYPEYINQYKSLYEEKLKEVGMTMETTPITKYF